VVAGAVAVAVAVTVAALAETAASDVVITAALVYVGVTPIFPTRSCAFCSVSPLIW
jgi:hypothetical protein